VTSNLTGIQVSLLSYYRSLSVVTK